MGRVRLLHVRRHEWRCGVARRALRLDHQPQLPRTAGAGRAYPFDVSGYGRGGRRDAKIIVTARNFGCGSSREAAVYSLYDYGIRCVIAPSFGDIFAGNAVQNGLLTAIVSDDDAATLMGLLAEKPDQPVTVDLEQQTIHCGDQTFRFAIDSVRRARLLNGWDNITLTESYMDKIAVFKMADRARRPWATPSH